MRTQVANIPQLVALLLFIVCDYEKQRLLFTTIRLTQL